MRQLRSDIQGLRALAVSLVVVFHFWPGLLPGGFVGVDVFFVISGFLITGHLLRDVEAQTFSVTRFWAKRIRRLIPASFTVLIVTAALVWLIAGSADQHIWFPEIAASASYVENWALSLSAVDYLALGNAPSPVQHFWSLSAEEQFYFLWPLLIAAAIWFAKRKRRNLRAVIFFGLLALTVGSLIYSIIGTALDPASAYFTTPTRIWEFGIGGLVAFLPRSHARASVVNLVFTISFVAILVSAFAINNTDAFPGALALWPTVATAVAIWAWPEVGLAIRLLKNRRVQFLGDISYSVYLWHWPIMVLTPMLLFTAQNLMLQMGELALTLLFAAFTRKQIELRFIERKSTARRTFVSMAAVAAVLIAASGAGNANAEVQIAKGLALTEKIGTVVTECVGAEARQPDGNLCSNPEYAGLLLPGVDLAAEDSMVQAYPQCPGISGDSSEVRVCHLGNRGASIRVALVGDSHANEYAGAFDLVGKANGYAVDVIAKGGCPLSYSQRAQSGALEAACRAWVAATAAYLKAHSYDAIVTSMKSGVTWQSNPTGATYANPVTGYSAMLRALLSTGAQVIYLKDNPRPIASILTCLRNNHGHEVASCSAQRSSALEAEPALTAIANQNSTQVHLINFDNVFCNTSTCEPVIGGVVVYRDDNHLTNTFVRSLTPKLKTLLANFIGSRG